MYFASYYKQYIDYGVLDTISTCELDIKDNNIGMYSSICAKTSIVFFSFCQQSERWLTMGDMLNFYANKKVVLLSELRFGLLLRKIVHSDLIEIAEWMKDKELVRYAFGAETLSDYDYRFASDNYMRLVSNPNSPCYFLAVCDIHSKILGLGKYDLRNMEGVGRVALSGLMMGRDNRGHGIGTKAMALINRFLFENEQVDLVEIETADYNLRAQHCFKRIGMEECEKLHSLEGICGYGLGENDAPKIFMRLSKEKYFAELATVNGILPQDRLPRSKENRDAEAP